MHWLTNVSLSLSLPLWLSLSDTGSAAWRTLPAERRHTRLHGRGQIHVCAASSSLLSALQQEGEWNSGEAGRGKGEGGGGGGGLDNVWQKR